jgi:hypothetical protein
MGRLHEKAAAAYNAKLLQLPARVQLRTMRPLKPAMPEPVKSDTHVVSNYGAGDIDRDSYREYSIDHTGKPAACYFYTRRGVVGLSGEDHDALLQVTQRIASDRAYRDFLSSKFVYECCIDWLKRKVEMSDKICSDFTDYLEEVAAKAVRRFEVWLPMPVVQIATPFMIGGVTFRRITKKMMDEWAQRLDVASSAKAEAVFDKSRSRLQSATAACVAVEAEPIRGNELAFERADASISILRFSCPAMLSPYQWAPVDPSFIDRRGASIMLHVEDQKILGETNSLDERMLTQWVLTREDIEFHMRTSWGFGHNLLVTDRNEFQEMLLGALIHYSRSILKSDMSERLLYMVTALESVFIRDVKESIVQNLRERMAALAGPTKADRLKILEAVAKVYDLRSGFVHRALPVSKMSMLQDFFMGTWSTFLFLLNNYNRWRKKSEFLRMVDEHKFSGPEFSTEDMPAV